MNKKIKPWEFYLLTILALGNLTLGFIGRNWLLILIAFAISMYLKPHTKTIPIPKAYRKIMKTNETTTVEDIAKNNVIKDSIDKK